MNLKGKTVLVTGATGFIGWRLAERLAREEGAQVRALARSKDKAAPFEREMADLPVEIVLGDLSDRDSLKRAAKDCQVVFHCAALASDRGSREHFYAANVTGTQNLLLATLTSGCRLFVHTSSVSVYGLDPQDGTDENSPFATSNNLYCETKIESEKAVRMAYEKEGLPYIIIRPGSVYGPRSSAWTIRPVKALKEGKMFLIGGGKGLINYVYIDNLIDGMLLAVENFEKTCDTFIITDGKSATWEEFFGYYGRMMGRKRLPSLPLPLAHIAALGMELGERITGQRAVLTRTAVGFLTRRATFNIEKARRHLGYQPKIDLDEGMQLTEAWLRQEKLI